MERANKTLQDRLVKELCLQSVDTLAAGNAMLPAFMADYSARFAKEPADAKDLHSPLSPADNFDDVFAWREERTVSNSLTLQYDKVLRTIFFSEFCVHPYFPCPAIEFLQMDWTD